MRRALTVVLVVLVTVGLAPATAVSGDEGRSDAVTLVRDGQADAVVVHWSRGPSPTPEFAATELRDYVRTMSGADLPVVEVNVRGLQPGLAGGVAVVTGPEANGFVRGRQREVPSAWFAQVVGLLEGKAEDAFAIDTQRGRLVLAGTTHRGTLYAAYEVLERLGVRFFAPQFDFYEGHAERVPQLSTVTVDPLQVTEEPSFAYRRKDVGEGWSHTAGNLPELIDWMAKQRLNTLAYAGGVGRTLVGWDLWREQLIPELQRRGMILEVGGHGYQNFLSPEEHQEYYTSGVNVFDVHNDEAVQAYVDEVVAYLEGRPEIDIFDAWPPDGSTWPEGASEKFGSIANAYSYVTSALIEGIREAGLDVTVEAIAYSSHIDPPDEQYAFDRATLVDFAPYDRSYTEPIFDDTYPRNVFYDELVQTWRQVFDGPLAFYEYYRKYSWHSLPVVLPELIGREMPYYHSRGLNGFGIYSEPADWITYELTHLLVAKLSWDVDMDSDAWLRTYLQERYGAAADRMSEYYAQVEAAGRTIFDRAPGNYGDLDVVTRARDYFLAANDAVHRARAVVGDSSTEAFLTDRLATNAEFAVADTEISYYALLGDAERQEQAKRRTKGLAEVHRFDGVILYSLWTVRRYQSDWGREPWIFAMYRGELATPLTLDSAPLIANGEPAEVITTLSNYGREGIENVEVILTAPSSWTVKPSSPTISGSVLPDPAQPFQVTWEVTPPADAAPSLDYLLEAEAVYSYRGEQASVRSEQQNVIYEGIAESESGAAYGISGTNVSRGADQLVIYTPAAYEESPANEFGAEAALVDGAVVELRDRLGGDDPSPLTIPENGVILSGHRAAREWLLVNALPGAAINLIVPGVGVGPRETPFGDLDAQATFHDIWDFRNEDPRQVISGSDEGARAVLGATEDVEDGDPSWSPSGEPDRTGSIPTVLSFDGVDDVVTLADIESAHVAEGFAFETWIYQRSRAPGARVFNFSPGMAFWVNNDGTLQSNVLNDAGTRVSPRSTETLPLERWTHVGLAYQVENDRATVRVFVNGREVSYSMENSLTDATLLAIGDSPPTLGNRGASDRGLDGMIAYARFISRAQALTEWDLEMFAVG